MKKFDNLGIKPADILLPKAGTDMHKWAVVACDQFTSHVIDCRKDSLQRILTDDIFLFHNILPFFLCDDRASGFPFHHTVTGR